MHEPFFMMLVVYCYDTFLLVVALLSSAGVSTGLVVSALVNVMLARFTEPAFTLTVPVIVVSPGAVMV